MEQSEDILTVNKRYKLNEISPFHIYTRTDNNINQSFSKFRFELVVPETEIPLIGENNELKR